MKKCLSILFAVLFVIVLAPTAFADSALNHMADEYIAPYLNGKGYHSQLITDTNICNSYAAQIRIKEAVSNIINREEPFDYLLVALISVAIGLTVGTIVVLIMKSRTKNIKKQNNSDEYTDRSSMTVTEKYDIFLYGTLYKVDENGRIHSEKVSGDPNETFKRSYWKGYFF